MRRKKLIRRVPWVLHKCAISYRRTRNQRLGSSLWPDSVSPRRLSPLARRLRPKRCFSWSSLC
ncbi:hypothetical protein KAX22_07365 [bacterium]|nr:hypothetical protein [bacterium]